MQETNIGKICWDDKLFIFKKGFIFKGMKGWLMVSILFNL
jgi:hypothetical protein